MNENESPKKYPKIVKNKKKLLLVISSFALLLFTSKELSYANTMQVGDIDIEVSSPPEPPKPPKPTMGFGYELFPFFKDYHWIRISDNTFFQMTPEVSERIKTKHYLIKTNYSQITAVHCRSQHMDSLKGCNNETFVDYIRVKIKNATTKKYQERAIHFQDLSYPQFKKATQIYQEHSKAGKKGLYIFNFPLKRDPFNNPLFYGWVLTDTNQFEGSKDLQGAIQKYLAKVEYRIPSEVDPDTLK